MLTKSLRFQKQKDGEKNAFKKNTFASLFKYGLIEYSWILISAFAFNVTSCFG